MDYERGAIVLVNFNPQRRPQEVGKLRPAIIVSRTELNNILDLVSVVPLTTNLIDGCEPLRIRIPKRDGLDETSDAMIEQLRAVAKSRIVARLAAVSPQEMERIEEGLRALLQLEQTDSSSSQ